MRVLMLEASARNDHAGPDERLDHGLVGVAFFALVIDDAFASKTGRRLRESSVFIHRIRNSRVQASGIQQRLVTHPNLEVFPTVPWRSVNKARANVIGYMVTRKKWDDEIISFVAKRMG